MGVFGRPGRLWVGECMVYGVAGALICAGDEDVIFLAIEFAVCLLQYNTVHSSIGLRVLRGDVGLYHWLMSIGPIG